MELTVTDFVSVGAPERICGPAYQPNDDTTKRAVAGGGGRRLAPPRLAADKDVTTAVDGGMEQLDAELLVDGFKKEGGEGGEGGTKKCQCFAGIARLLLLMPQRSRQRTTYKG